MIDKNGDNLKECILKYSEDWGYGGEFEKWIETENHFTNTLVDRIVTGYPRDDAKEMEQSYGYLDDMIDTAEIFHLWVIAVSYTHLDVYKRQVVHSHILNSLFAADKHNHISCTRYGGVK